MIPIRDDAPRFGTPYVNYFLIAANVVVFLFEVMLPAPLRDQVMFQFGFVPLKISALMQGVHHIAAHGYLLPVTADTAIVPIFSSMFLHASWLHLIFNMWALWIFGDNIEDYLGHFLYLIFYFLSGFGAAALHYVLNSSSHIPSVGASGAIAGVMGAYLVLFPSARVLTLVPLFVFFTFIHLPAWLVLGYWFVAQFLSGAATAIAYSSQTGQGGGVAFWAHVGGFLTGISFIKLFPTRPARYRFGAWYGRNIR
jgi:membrane associated rhomboid family serine protease